MPTSSVHLDKETRFSESMPCDHCERPCQPDALGLCPSCAAVEGIVVLYVHRRGWTPEREARIRELRRRASLQLPLFEPDERQP
jgi:hypothetical protein